MATNNNGYIATGTDKASIHFVNNHLSYTGQDCHHIPDALGKLYGQKVQILDLSFNSLYNLKGLNGFQTLQELILDNNELNDNIQFPLLPYLHTLSLNKNNITNLEQLIEQIYEKLPQLTYLSLLGNKACPDQLTDIEKDENDYQRYRYYVLYKLPKLKFLDSTKVTEEERLEALRRGKFMKVVRPTDNNLKLNKRDNDLEAIEKNYTPLSATNPRSSDEHRGAYGKMRYRYSGKHSEGNRFIKNNDL
ncbi:leucine-rich melanocyte differentiation-associated protein-like isoform X2 [Chrysoperla carnea]|uniref:leucine-rich melanocyte differentiation-associated protein-like isoform X2 n=1 Tax=Chrysoperla carnea TaxID=189513 RepID=UPI001D0894CE|nr:leucine-rich melanocyte differentiation-associated protein-like isoform X2 [Chrysoperla carnea]